MVYGMPQVIYLLLKFNHLLTSPNKQSFKALQFAYGLKQCLLRLLALGSTPRDTWC